MPLSQQVLDRKRSAQAVRSALVVFKGRIVEGTGEVFGPAVPGAIAILLDAMVARLDEALAAMMDAEAKLSDERADDADKRARRKAAKVALREKLLETRQVIEALYGPAFARSLGFEGRLSSQPHMLHAIARSLLSRLESARPPPPRLPGVVWSAEAFAAPLRPLAQELGAALTAVSHERPQENVVLVDKERAVAAFDAVFTSTADLTSALLAAVGEKKLASRVRPSTRRPGRTVGLVKREVEPA